ncbi:site-2 protease family protein [bacterium]|nr:site-2 protease family protein [bacterium]
MIIHELAHGYMALRLGDSTARDRGRLSFNPIKHLDPMGSVLIPGLLMISGAPFLLGWAKPVPVDTSNFKSPVKDMMFVALAGPMSNLFIGFTSLLVYSVFMNNGFFEQNIQFYRLSTNVVAYFFQLNIYLAVFNLLPIPPLDGSRILAFFLSREYQAKLYRLEQYGFLIIFLLATFDMLSPIVTILSYPLIGLARYLF